MKKWPRSELNNPFKHLYMKTRLEVVRLDDIVVSLTNPRETFEEADLNELAASIKQDGVFQPILVRPLPNTEENSWLDLTDPGKLNKPRQPRFELVCGERRYRASKIAAAEDIPANIRELTDNQAFELQIIENLQRKDVHPLEEAKAYKRMLDSGRYAIPDVAAKVAKPISFIEQRLKLNDLIDPIKKDFFKNELGIGHAVEIARLTLELQEGLLKHYKKRYDISGWGTHAQLKKEIATQSYDLSKAQFDINLGYGVIAPCSGCQFRSASRPELFADMETDSCFNKSCYNNKTEAFIAQKAEEILTSGKNIMLARSKYNDLPAAVQEVVGKQNAPVINNYQGYQGANMVRQKVFHVAGHDAGKIEEVWVPKSQVKADPDTETGIKDEIARIEERARRALELDQEKIFIALVNALKGDTLRSIMPVYNLDAGFVEALTFYLAISDSLWGMQSEIKKITGGMSFEFTTPEELLAAYAKLTPEQRKRLMVAVAFRKWHGELSDRTFGGKIMRQLADSKPKVDVAGIVAGQNAVAAARTAKTELRLAELRKKFDKPKKEGKKPVKR